MQSTHCASTDAADACVDCVTMHIIKYIYRNMRKLFSFAPLFSSFARASSTSSYFIRTNVMFLLAYCVHSDFA